MSRNHNVTQPPLHNGVNCAQVFASSTTSTSASATAIFISETLGVQSFEHICNHRLSYASLNSRTSAAIISRIKKTPPATQEECGAQMGNQKAWQEHVEGHKAKLKAKIINSVR